MVPLLLKNSPLTSKYFWKLFRGGGRWFWMIEKPVEPPQNNKHKITRNYLKVTPTSHLAFTREAPPEVPVAPASFFSRIAVSVVVDRCFYI